MQAQKEYFAAPKTVVEWWNPETSLGGIIYERGLNKTLSVLSQFSEIHLVLDAACGKGRASTRLSQKYSVTCVDISSDMLAHVAAKKLDNVKLVQSDIDHMPFPDSTFDAAVCLEAFVHFIDSRQSLVELYRALKPGGILIIDIDNNHGAIRIMKNISNFFFTFFDAEYKKERAMRNAIYHTLAPHKIKQDIAHAGFDIKEIFYTGVIMPFTLKNYTILSETIFKKISWINALLERLPLVKRLGTYAYFVCQKPYATNTK